MRKWLAVVGTAGLLSGCLTFSEFDRNLSAFHGQPAQAAFDVLGYPDLQQQFGGDTVYTWATSGRRSLPVPTASTTTGLAGGVPYTATTTGTGSIDVAADCKVKLVTDAAGVITRHQYEGTDLGCESYMRRLYKAARK